MQLSQLILLVLSLSLGTMVSSQDMNVRQGTGQRAQDEMTMVRALKGMSHKGSMSGKGGKSGKVTPYHTHATKPYYPKKHHDKPPAKGYYFKPKKHTEYYADLGKYGTFDLTISADEGTMMWKSDLKNIHELAEALNITTGIPTLNYHLHNFWALQDVNYAIGGTLCGANNTGGHYDPFFACGPASGVPNATCIAIGRPRDPTRYTCSPRTYQAGLYDECEVGDLSGKEGPLIVASDGTASGKSAFPDPMAALNSEFVDTRATAPFNRWETIMFHNGEPRVLCAKLFKKY